VGSPIDTGVLGSISIEYCSRFGVEMYDRSEMGDNCLATGCAEATAGLPVREPVEVESCRE